MVEPIEPTIAKVLATTALSTGELIIDAYARGRMLQRRISIVDVLRIIKSGAYQHAEMQNGTWRYPIWTPSITVVIAFRSFEPPKIALVTVYRNGR